MDPDLRTAVLAAIAAESSATSTADRGDYAAHMLAYLQTRPEFSETGMDSSGNVGGLFTDGVPFIIFSAAGQSETSPGRDEPAHAGRSLARDDDQIFRVINAFTVPSVATYLSNRGSDYTYGLDDTGARGASLSALRDTDAASALYINAHGGLIHGHYLFLSNDARDVVGERPLTAGATASQIALHDDWVNHRLGLGLDPDDEGTPRANTAYYGVNSDFVTAHWTLAPGAVVYAGACESADSVMANAVIGLGARAYFGWTDDLTPSVNADSARFVFDQLLGANIFEAESPKQRAFPAAPVFQNMQSNHASLAHATLASTVSSTHQVLNSNLALTPPGATGILAPGIANMDVDETAHTLTLHGDFGDDPGADRSATIGGTTVDVKSWAADLVVLSLPAQSGLGGAVQVKAHGHKSNSVPLTAWQGAFHYKTALTAQDASGELDSTVDFAVEFHADIHSYRDTPGQTPHAPAAPVPFRAADESAVNYLCTGELVGSAGTVSITGSGSLTFNTGDPRYEGYEVAGTVDRTQSMLNVAVWFGADAGLCNTSGGEANIVEDAVLLNQPQHSTTNEFNPRPYTMTSDFRVTANQLADHTANANLKDSFAWDNITPKNGSTPPSDGSEDIGQ